MKVVVNRELLNTLSVSELLKAKEFFLSMIAEKYIVNADENPDVLEYAKTVTSHSNLVINGINDEIAERFLILENKQSDVISTVGQEAVKRWLTDSQ